ncbi:MAG TPA: hypothetical protein VGR15_06960 [Bacteroidota bacterium]|nr:hypothetical protein [Bacteroidota bacterium]
MKDFGDHIIRTLLYYDIFDHPLMANELFFLFPRNTLTKSEFSNQLLQLAAEGVIRQSDKYFSLPKTSKDLVNLRAEREQLARKRMRIARLMAHLIKRFPFVRGVFLSGDLSKGVAHPESDIDYVIVTAPHRLWICRSFLVLFKKTFLFNSKRYFCLNYYVAENSLELDDQNYYTATEIAHLKPLYNIAMFLKYENANVWIRRFFPNYRVFAFSDNEANSRPSILQQIVEFFIQGRLANHLDRLLMEAMKRIWAKRYPQYDPAMRDKIFRCTPTESCAYVGNFSDKILSLYNDRLREYDLPA